MILLLTALAAAQATVPLTDYAEAVTPPPRAVTAPAAVAPVDEELLRALEADAPRAPEGGEGAAAAGSPASALNPDIAFIADFALAAFSEHDPLPTGAHAPQENGFNFQQLEMAIGSSVDPYFRFDSSLLFNPFGVEIEEAYATTLALPWSLQLRAGQFLTRFGRFNPTHPHTWSFVDQPLVLAKFFGDEANRGLGAELSYLFPLPWYVELLASSTDARGDATARSFLGDAEWEIGGPADLQTTLALKQFFPFGDDWSLSWGLSSAFGPNATGRGNRTDIYGTDVYLKWRPISTAEGDAFVALQGELLHRRRQLPGDLLSDTGGYGQFLWHFSRRWETGVRGEWTQGEAGDPLDPEWTSARKRYAAQLTFFPTEFSRVRMQANYDMPGWREAYWGAFLNFEVSIGAHGAHTF